jgi:hypothetical protein
MRFVSRAILQHAAPSDAQHASFVPVFSAPFSSCEDKGVVFSGQAEAVNGAICAFIWTVEGEAGRVRLGSEEKGATQKLDGRAPRGAGTKSNPSGYHASFRNRRRLSFSAVGVRPSK